MATTQEPPVGGLLPAETTSFVGRLAEVAEARKLLASVPVLTLTGPGGVGKTRLALSVASQVRRVFPGGVRFVDLAPLQDLALLPYTLADALGISSSPATRGQIDVIIDVLRDRQVLIVMDNCEHVIDAAAAVTAALIRSLPDLRILATSRQPLGVAGEHILTVAPLPVSDRDADLTPRAAALEHPALGLFADRAQAATGFTLTRENWRDAARLCARLDGLPLAIELAAVSSRILSPAQMLERLDDWTAVLSGGDRSGPRRHRSLIATVEWSYELCTPQERLLWARASVFAGSFTLEHAEAVCADDELPPSAVLSAVTALVDKSVFTSEEHLGRIRYRLLETLSSFGRDKLRAAGETKAFTRRHRTYYLDLAEEMLRSWFGPDQLTWIERMRAEHADLRAALAAHIADNDVNAAQSMAAALRHHWLAGHMTEGRLWSARVLALEPAVHEPLTRARALYTQGLLGAVQADHVVVGPALNECRELAREGGDRVLEGMATAGLALVAYSTADMSRALELADEALAVPEYAASTERCMALVVLALASEIRGEHDRGLAISKQLLDLCDEHQEQSYRSWALLAEARCRLRSGTVTPARARELLLLKRAFHEVAGISSALILLTRATIQAGDAERGAVLIGISHRYRYRVGVEATAVIYQHEDFEDRCRESLGDKAYEAGYQRGFDADTDIALDFALGMDRTGEQTAADDDPLTARERQVAAFVGDGMSNKDIAAELVISLRTAEGHVQRILAKLGFTSRTQLAAWSAARR
ncbi:ATP-binding protein [Streptomyces fildesensis]|uniref:ATP-binding protein n=1 Tax=Streptomyces fildesensis TaxID=375757 RepID=A0ABW8C382_9ACTN